MVARLLLMVGLIVSLGCSNGLMRERQRSHAPTSQKDVGVTLMNFDADQVERILRANPKAEVRVLNAEHGLYEIFHVNPATIVPRTGQLVTNNRYFKAKWDSQDSTPISQRVKIGNWPECEPSSNSPTAKLVTSIDRSDLELKTLKGRQVLEVSSQSLADPTVGGKLKTAFLLVSPNASSIKEKWEFKNTAKFEMQALGKYGVLVAVQDKNNSCAVDVVRFVITDNQPFKPRSAGSSYDMTQFTHLPLNHAESAWELSRGDDVLVAVLDSGISYNNFSLGQNMWVNQSEVADNNADDDGNTFADDVVGWDFINNDPYPFDDDGHGTHVAGLIAAKEFGIAPNAKVMSVKVVNSFGGDYATVAAGVMYAVDRGAKILNMSLGGNRVDPTISRAFEYARSKGVLVVVASGNGDSNNMGYDIDMNPVFPAALTDENIIAVGAYDRNNALSPYSNFGKKSVDIVAPGGFTDDLIFSLAYDNPNNNPTLGLMGTSMATPQVAGVAAQIWSLRPHFTAEEVRSIIMDTGNPVEALKSITVSGSVLDAEAAVRLANSRSTFVQ